MANRRFTQFFSTLHNKPVLLDCNFQVAPADSAGKGTTNVKGGGVQNVFMHTSAPAVGSGNPNPAAGFIYVQLQDNYNKFFSSWAEFLAPASGTPIVVTAAGAHLTVGQVYQITKLGTTTAANWVTLGLPIGTTAALGVSFVAAATGAGTGTGEVQLPTGSGVDSVEVVGTPNLMIASQSATIAGQTNGSYLIFQCLAGGIVTAPATGSVGYLCMYFGNSAILNNGE